MSNKTTIIKKLHRDVRREKGKIINLIAKEMLTQPLRERLKLAWKIVKG